MANENSNFDSELQSHRQHSLFPAWRFRTYNKTQTKNFNVNLASQNAKFITTDKVTIIRQQNFLHFPHGQSICRKRVSNLCECQNMWENIWMDMTLSCQFYFRENFISIDFSAVASFAVIFYRNLNFYVTNSFNRNTSVVTIITTFFYS